MTRIRFHQGLEQLKQKLLVMGGLAEQALDLSIRAFRERDAQLCQPVFDAENAINAVEREIDELALDLLAMQQPMATDLRFILAVIKINSDLERVGDQAVNIAERLLDMGGVFPADLPVDIPRMATLAAGMVRQALQAFLTEDPDLARKVLDTDDSVDRMNREVFAAMDKTIRERQEIAHQALDALLIARSLERVADHATNIAEDVIFWTRGADVRHRMGEGY